MAQSHIGLIQVIFLGEDQAHFPSRIYAGEIKQAGRAKRVLPFSTCMMVLLATIEPFDSQLLTAACRGCLVDYSVTS